MKKANLEHIPVISFSFSGIEHHPGFKVTLPMLHRMIYAVLYGDLIMSLVNQVLPYEINKGDADALAAKWAEKLGGQLSRHATVNYSKIKDNYKRITEEFSQISIEKTEKVKVGIVGEIFVKYSPLANNNLEKFLISEGAEVVVPGLIDFCLYIVYNNLMEYKLYHRKNIMSVVWKTLFGFIDKKKNDIISVVSKNGKFEPWTEFKKIIDIPENLISVAVKMGEGWLLTAEMLELANSGCLNIVCTQPFGRLPNHICGKGMMKPLKELKPDINIVAIDYDAGASRVKQENRLKLMLANANKSASKIAGKELQTC